MSAAHLVILIVDRIPRIFKHGIYPMELGKLHNLIVANVTITWCSLLVAVIPLNIDNQWVTATQSGARCGWPHYPISNAVNPEIWLSRINIGRSSSLVLTPATKGVFPEALRIAQPSSRVPHHLLASSI